MFVRQVKQLVLVPEQVAQLLLQATQTLSVCLTKNPALQGPQREVANWMYSPEGQLEQVVGDVTQVEHEASQAWHLESEFTKKPSPQAMQFEVATEIN